MVCPTCQTENPGGARFCLNCGNPLTLRCSSCETELPLGARFCMNCGQPVSPSTPFATQPALVLDRVNQRILQETHTDMFVTVFYGVLEPESGLFTYCNAGHNPPFLVRADHVEAFTRTGLPLGIVGDTTWEEGTARLACGDALVLYTDGVTDAQTAEGTLFGQERLLGVIQACQEESRPAGTNAEQMEKAVLDAIHEFVGDAPRFDDLTLMVVAREGT